MSKKEATNKGGIEKHTVDVVSFPVKKEGKREEKKKSACVRVCVRDKE